MFSSLKKLLFLSIPLLFSQLPGLALADDNMACVLESPVHIGASVTAETPEVLQLLRSLNIFTTYYNGLGKPLNPGQKVSRYFHAQMSDGFSQESLGEVLWGYDRSRHKNLAIAFSTKVGEHEGYMQVHELINKNGENRAIYEEASIIFGVDLFYWDTVWNMCRFRNMEPFIKDFVETVSQDGKTLVLATVPKDKAEYVPISRLSIGNRGLWWPPVESCVDEVNSALHKHCTIDESCFLVDLEKDVERLQQGERLTTPLSGHSYSLRQLRPDGVHLSRAGNRYLAEQVIAMMYEHPPQCSREK